jgi:hypothetical protein
MKMDFLLPSFELIDADYLIGSLFLEIAQKI